MAGAGIRHGAGRRGRRGPAGDSRSRQAIRRRQAAAGGGSQGQAVAVVRRGYLCHVERDGRPCRVPGHHGPARGAEQLRDGRPRAPAHHLRRPGLHSASRRIGRSDIWRGMRAAGETRPKQAG